MDLRKLLISAVLVVSLLVTAVSCVDEETAESERSSAYSEKITSSAAVSDISSEASSYTDSTDPSLADPYQDIIDDLDELERIINELDDLTEDDLEVPEP